jgi:hypothetical protein
LKCDIQFVVVSWLKTLSKSGQIEGFNPLGMMRWTIVGSGYFLTFMVSEEKKINVGLEGTSQHGF